MPKHMIRLPRQSRNDKQILEMVEECGMKVDREYGVVPLDQTGAAVMLRGDLDQTAIQNLIQAGAEIFPEITIAPFNPSD